MKRKNGALCIMTFFVLFFNMAPSTFADGKYPVRIVEENLVVFTVDEETLQVIQVMNFKNNGTQKEKELPIYLPEGHEGLQLRDGLTQDQIKTVEKGFIDTTGLEPGQEKQVVVSYLMPIEDQSSFWTVEQSYVTETFYVVVPAGELSFQANGLKTQSELLEMNGTDLRRFTRVDVHPGEKWSLSFRVLKTSKAGGNAESEKETHPNEKFTADGKRIIGQEGSGYGKAVFTLIVVFIALAVALVGLRRDRLGKNQKSGKLVRPWLQSEKETLLQKVGQLEQDHASGLISKETYSSTKNQLREQLIRITMELRRG